MSIDKTHYRKAFNSPYLSSADLIDPVTLTIREVKLEPDRTKRTTDRFNTAYFVESELRADEPLKPMILNAVNSKVMKERTGSPFIEDWSNVPVTIYVEPNVRYGRETVEGLRISPMAPEKKPLTPDDAKAWERAKKVYRKDGNLDRVLAHRAMSANQQQQLIAECDAVA